MGSRICPIRESLVRTSTYDYEFLRERKILVTYKKNGWIRFFLFFYFFAICPLHQSDQECNIRQQGGTLQSLEIKAYQQGINHI